MTTHDIIIGVNGNDANIEHRVGVGQYAYGLLCHLPRSKVFLSHSPRPDMPLMDYEVLPGGGLWTLTTLQKRLFRAKDIDVFFTPTHYAPLLLPMPSVISIMDMGFERFPQYFKKKDLYQLKYWTALSAKSAKKILTISEFSKDEICQIYKFPREKVVVTYPGYDQDRFNPQVKKETVKIQKVLHQYKIGNKGFFLFLGTLQPRKNLERLIEAYSQLPNCPWKLVIVGMINEGRGGWKNEGIFAKVKTLGLEDRVIFTGYVPDKDIPYLMAQTIALLLPSLYEGFGIPAVEAMAVGTTIVVSRVSSLPEICGESAVYIQDPYNVNDVFQALRQVQQMPAGELVHRVQLGLTWVKRYNWKDTAKKTLEVLYEVAER